MTAHNNSNLDEGVDVEIAACLNIKEPRSFFLFAGAGSGKTRSLVKALNHLRSTYAAHLKMRGQRIAVITYTNAACDEINRRLEFDPLVQVSTIHSFACLLIQGFDKDIRDHLRLSLAQAIRDLAEEEARGKQGTKASLSRQASIAAKQNRLAKLNIIKRFVYSPTGDNRSRESLNHAEVIKIAAAFLSKKPTMRRILTTQYPFLLIDESQDTNKELIDALLLIQPAHRVNFCLGLLGDTMQRIYADGKINIEQALPDDWIKPAKRLNHRCPQRVVELINKIRSPIDDQQQVARSDSVEGFVRFFILPGDTTDKAAAERTVADSMSQITSDPEWKDPAKCKTLILEHHMAASRMHFLEMFAPLYQVEDYRTGLLNGSLPVTRFFTGQVLSLIRAQNNGDKFAVAKIVRESSPLLCLATLRGAADQRAQLTLAKEAIQSLKSLWSSERMPTFKDVLENIAKSNLFFIPDSLIPYAKLPAERATDTAELSDDDQLDSLPLRAVALEEFLSTSFAQIEPYALYVSGNAPFATHQGVKGLEFPRVMVVIDDGAARGFMFNYEKLFGAADEKTTDHIHVAKGAETTIDRTRRLLYVTCSRAQKSLAIVAYASNPPAVKKQLLDAGWCDNLEMQVGY